MKSRRYFYEFAVVSLIVLLICSILLIPKKLVYANTGFSENEVNELNDEATAKEIVSYKEVFTYYYEKVKDKYYFVHNCIGFEDFIDRYYSQNQTIGEFSDSITVDEFTEKFEKEQEVFEDNHGLMPMGEIIEILSPDEDYILGPNLNNNLPTGANDFNYIPDYEAFDYTIISVGDIAFEGGSKSAAKHAAFIYQTRQPSCYGEYVQTIEAVAGGVQYGLLDDDRMVRFGISIFRIYRATELGVVANARQFIESQLGKPYSLNYTRTKTERNSKSWYCSELIFAAYYNAGMDICSTREFEFNPDNMPCLPVYLTRGMLSAQINLNNKYLRLSIEKFNDSWLWNKAYWTIKITNSNYNDITVYYNSKMCYTADAKDWQKLKDVNEIIVGARSSVSVNIYQNLSATSVATSFLSDGYRFVTYGTELSKVDFTIVNGNNKIALL